MINVADILRGKILIVDDQEANVLLLERMLRDAGYTSIASTIHPHQVCELHRQNRYSLILLDLQMPGLDGFQVMESLKKIETEGYLPVLVITAQPDEKLRALRAGAKDFISKPFDFAEVLIRVYNLLEVRLLHLETKKRYDEVVGLLRWQARHRFDGRKAKTPGAGERSITLALAPARICEQGKPAALTVAAREPGAGKETGGGVPLAERFSEMSLKLRPLPVNRSG